MSAAMLCELAALFLAESYAVDDDGGDEREADRLASVSMRLRERAGREA